MKPADLRRFSPRWDFPIGVSYWVKIVDAVKIVLFVCLN